MSGVAVNRYGFTYTGERTQNLSWNAIQSVRSVAILPSPVLFPVFFDFVSFFLFFFFSNFYSDSPVRLLQTSAVNFLGAELNGARERFSLFETLVPGEISTG